MRILLHPGFHKTGTSSLQYTATAPENAALLNSDLIVWTTGDILPAIRSCRRYSARPARTHLVQFAKRFRSALSDLDPDDGRALLISSEDLCGWLPGGHGVLSYSTAPALLATAVDTIHNRFGGAADVGVWFTTRESESWLASVYWQNLCDTRLTEDYETWRITYWPAAQLDRVVTAVADHLKGLAPVTSSAIESYDTTPLGSLVTALDHLGVPRDGLRALPRQNVSVRDAMPDMLALNRSALDDTAYKSARRDLLKQLRRRTHPAPRRNGPKP